MSERYFFARHGERTDKSSNPESEKYKGITESGLEKIKENTEKIRQMIDNASPNAVVNIGGSSEEDRTRSTADAIGDYLSESYSEDPNTITITRHQITIQKESGEMPDTISYITHQIENNPDKRIIISYPLFLKEFSIRPHFRDQNTGKTTDLTNDLYKAAQENEQAATHILMGGEGSQNIDFPVSPQQLADKQKKGLQRLREFSRRFIKDREIIIGFVGHAWDLDALASDLANQGQADYEGFIKSGGQEIEQAEVGIVDIKEGKTVFSYRDQEFKIIDQSSENQEQ